MPGIKISDHRGGEIRDGSGVVIVAGTMLITAFGEYADYTVVNVVRALRDFIPADTLIASQDSKLIWGDWLVEQGYCENVPTLELWEGSGTIVIRNV